MLIFTDKYLKGYEFDHAKVSIAFGCKPHSPEAYRILDAIHSLHRDSYIAGGIGRSMEPGSEDKIILVLASGDDKDELEKQEVKIEPWFEEATKAALSGPYVYINQDDG